MTCIYFDIFYVKMCVSMVNVNGEMKIEKKTVFLHLHQKYISFMNKNIPLSIVHSMKLISHDS